MKVPSFLLRRLYLKNSLTATQHGFEFQLRNQLGSGYARKLFPLTVDGVEIPLSSASFVIGDKTSNFTDVSNENPFTLAMNKVTTIKVVFPLDLEPHTIGMKFEVAGLGELGFEFTDLPANDPR